MIDEASEQSRQIERLLRGMASLPVAGDNAAAAPAEWSAEPEAPAEGDAE